MSTPSDSFSVEDEQNRQPDRDWTPVDATDETSSNPESALPPEAQGEANGGPLGCCLGIVVGLLLTFFLITIISVSIHNGGYLGFATLPIGILGAIVGGFLGWKVGKAIYHEYELSPERRERLERVEREWRARRKNVADRSL